MVAQVFSFLAQGIMKHHRAALIGTDPADRGFEFRNVIALEGLAAKVGSVLVSFPIVRAARITLSYSRSAPFQLT